MTEQKFIRFAIAAAIFAAAIFFIAPVGQAASNVTVRVMTYNIHHAEGLDGKVDTQRIANLILQENVDIVGLQEVDRNTTRVNGRDLIAELAQQTGMNFVFSNNMSYQGGQYGNAILSRFPIKSRDHRLVSKIGVNEQRGWLKAVVDVHGRSLSFWTSHISHNDEAERALNVSQFNGWVTNETVPVIFVGDFNAIPGSSTYTSMTEKWNDLWPQAGQGNGYTIPVLSPNRRIDYIWASSNSPIRAVKAHVPVTQASDHLPVVMELLLTNSAAPYFFFSFDEKSGSNIVDSAQGLTGTLGPGSPARSTNGPTGQAGDRSLYFDGTRRATVTLANQTIEPNGTDGSYALQAWVKLPLNFVPADRMILFQHERIPGFSLSITTNRTVHTTAFRIKDIPSTAEIPDDGKWHHVAVVHEDGKEMRFYIDAELSDTIAYTNGMGSRSSPAITFGASAVGANPFTGHLDRVRFDNRALNVDQFDFPAGARLGIRKTENGVSLTWPTSKSDYGLQFADRSDSSAWTNLFHSAHENENPVEIAPSGSAMFFRLMK